MTCATEDVISQSDMDGLNSDIATIDDVVESSLDTTTTKNGKIINTLLGQLKLLGFEPPVNYAASIVFGVGDNTKTVDEAGVIYAPLPSALPFTTSGTFIGDDDARFFVVQGITLNNLGDFATLSFDDIAAMVASINVKIGDIIDTAEHTIGVGGEGGNKFLTVAVTGGVDDNGSLIKSVGNTAVEFIGLFPGGIITAKQFGATGDGSTNDLPSIDAATDYLLTIGGGEVFFTPTTNSYDLGSGSILTRGNALTFRGPNNRSAKITTTNVSVFANDGTTVRSYINIRDLFCSTTANSAKVIDFTYWTKFDISENITEFAGTNGAGIYATGTIAGLSPSLGGGRNNDIAVLGGAINASGYHWAAFISAAGDTIRGPNSINFTGGRVANCKQSVNIEAGNNNTFAIYSESVVTDGFDLVLGLATATHAGTATSGTSSSLVDTGANFAQNVVNGGVTITAGTGAGQTRKIEGSNATSIFTKNPWLVVPDATSVYQVFPADAINNTFINMRSEGSLTKAGFLRRRAGSYQNEIFGGSVSSLGSGVLISEDQFDFSDTNNFSGLKEPQVYSFFQDDVAASQSGVQINYQGNSIECVLPTDGEIVGISILSNQALTAGTLIVKPSINGVTQTLSATLDSVIRPTDNIQVLPFGTDPIGGRNRRLGVEITTDGAFLPITTDIVVNVYILPRN